MALVEVGEVVLSVAVDPVAYECREDGDDCGGGAFDVEVAGFAAAALGDDCGERLFAAFLLGDRAGADGGVGEADPGAQQQFLAVLLEQLAERAFEGVQDCVDDRFFGWSARRASASAGSYSSWMTTSSLVGK